MVEKIVVFGYGKFGRSVCAKLKEIDCFLKVKVATQENFDAAKEDGLDVEFFNIYSDKSIEEAGIKSASKVVCAMDDNHENLFLALSIREICENAYIMALSNSINVTGKLKMAGVNRVIDMYNLSGLMIKNILTKPVASEFLQGFINHSHSYIFKEYQVEYNSKFWGRMVDEIDFEKFDIIFVGMVDLEKGKHFIFYTSGQEHKIDTNDTLILVGEEENINRFIEFCEAWYGYMYSRCREMGKCFSTRF